MQGRGEIIHYLLAVCASLQSGGVGASETLKLFFSILCLLLLGCHSTDVFLFCNGGLVFKSMLLSSQS